MTRGQRWTREELLAVLYFYTKYKGELTTPQNHPLIENLANAMGRTVASIAMRIANYKSVDPADSGRGLEADGPYMEIWREYEGNPDSVLAEARQAYQKFIPAEISKEWTRSLEDLLDGLEDEMAEGNSSGPKSKSDFELLDVPVGSILTFKDDDDVICKVVQQNPPKVSYKGEVVTISKAAKMALESNSSVNGNRYWKYDGELLWDRRVRLEELPNKAHKRIDGMEIIDEAFNAIGMGPESPDEKQTSGTYTEKRYKVIEASNRTSFESRLNEEAGWKLHSFSVATNPAQPGTTSQKVVILAVLERLKTTIGTSSGD